ncbi:MAG TPA: PrsW family intramembrane metalloprotease [Kofleriaceae bacterium]|nr:PrsW family intramembrane metalloprotease [Kofleriaceae bacterium]
MDATTPYYFALAGAIPALIAMWWIDRLDAKRPEPPRLLRKAAFYGTLSAVAAIIGGLIVDSVVKNVAMPPHGFAAAAFKAFIIAGLVEEVCKFGAMRIAVWNKADFDERMDGIVYASRAALGFALVENMLYMFSQRELGTAMLVFVLRACLSVPGHMMWTGIAGAFAARRRFDQRGTGTLGGLFVATLFHGLFDFSIFAMAPLSESIGDAAAVLLVGPFVLTYVVYRYFRRLQRAALAADNADPVLAGRHVATAAPAG